ncbi:hypothetical protein HK104_007820, partial [Borealophlyctis nickersoniae]
NQDLLSTTGLLTRILYEHDLSTHSRIHTALAPSSSSDTDLTYLLPRGTHTMQSFTFHPSTPSPLITPILQTSFVKCCKSGVSIVSSRGVRDVRHVRVGGEDVKSWVKTVPLVPKEVMEKCDGMMRWLMSQGVLQPFSLNDAIAEVEIRELSVEECNAVLKWWVELRKVESVTVGEVGRFLGGVRVPGSGGRKLKDVRYFVPVRWGIGDLPVAPDVLPVEVARGLNKEDLQRYFG